MRPIRTAEPGSALTTALVAESSKKSGLVWVSVGAQRARAVWHLWHEGAAYVVIDGLEQKVPGLADAATATVSVPSKDKGSRLIGWIAEVNRIKPKTDEWSQVVPLLHAKRLNAPDGEAQPARWAAESVVLRLRPTGEIMPPSADDPSAPPPPTPATSPVPIPFTLSGWRSRRRG